MLMFWVYILQNPKGRFYIGHSDDLITRVANHNRVDKTLGKFTGKNGPWVLPWSEEHAARLRPWRREHLDLLRVLNDLDAVLDVRRDGVGVVGTQFVS